jgi:hypothetical protein
VIDDAMYELVIGNRPNKHDKRQYLRYEHPDHHYGVGIRTHAARLPRSLQRPGELCDNGSEPFDHLLPVSVVSRRYEKFVCRDLDRILQKIANRDSCPVEVCLPIIGQGDVKLAHMFFVRRHNKGSAFGPTRIDRCDMNPGRGGNILKIKVEITGLKLLQHSIEYGRAAPRLGGVAAVRSAFKVTRFASIIQTPRHPKRSRIVILCLDRGLDSIKFKIPITGDTPAVQVQIAAAPWARRT